MTGRLSSIACEVLQVTTMRMSLCTCIGFARPNQRKRVKGRPFPAIVATKLLLVIVLHLLIVSWNNSLAITFLCGQIGLTTTRMVACIKVSQVGMTCKQWSQVKHNLVDNQKNPFLVIVRLIQAMGLLSMHFGISSQNFT